MGAKPSPGHTYGAHDQQRRLAAESEGFGELAIPFPGFAELIERPPATPDELRDAIERLESARRQVELERQRSEDLFEFAPDGYLITDLKGVIRECNKAAETLFDRPKHHLVGKSLASFIALEDRAAYRRRLRVLGRLERASEWELRLQPREDARIFAGVTVALVRDQQGDPAALRWLLRDQTRRKQAEAALAEREARHRFLTEEAQDAIYLFRFAPEPHLEYISPAIENITGYAREEFYGDLAFLVRLVHPEDRSLVDRYAQNMEDVEDLATPTTVRLLHKSGETVWVEQRATLIRDEAGKPVAVEAIVRDVTERVRTEAQLEKLRTEFLVILAHEFRTPLTGIKGSAALGLSPDSPPKPREAHELFEIIDEQADRLRELVSNLLDIAQIESGILTLNREEVDAATLFKEAHETFGGSGETHKIVLDFPDGLPLLKVDRRRVQQVVTNLLSNAAHVSPAAEPIILSAQCEEGGVLVQVQDHGRGIPLDKLPLLFRKFYKVDEVADRGAGLGLAISRGIVEAHGGRIWAESAGKNDGATFSFTLPGVA